MKATNLISLFLIGAIGSWSAGCDKPRTVREYSVGATGSPTMKNVTEEEYWKEQVDERIALEAAGKKPEGYESWQEYYQWWFGVLRKKRKPPFKSPQFKSSEDMVTYIKEKRRARHLPDYD